MGQDDAEILFWGLALASDRGCGNGGFAARSGRAFRDQCEFVGQMAAALAGGRERGAKAAWRKCFSTGRVCGADIGSGCRAAGFDLGRDLGRAAQTANSNQPQFALAVSRSTRHHPQKKACGRRNRNGQTWCAPGDVGCENKACLIPLAWYLSTRLRSAPIWSASGGGLPEASD